MAITSHHLQELMAELRDLDEVVEQRAQEAAKLVKNARHLLVLTGAGISTSAGISCYRGPEGVWTCKAQGRALPCGTPIPEAAPTPAHMGLLTLHEAGLLGHVGSQNVDGLHVRSGIPLRQITEVHGNMFKEWCPACGIEYIREGLVYGGSLVDEDGRRGCSECAGKGQKCHCTSTACAQCGGVLQDTVIDFEQQVRPEHLDMLFAQAAAADVCLVLGTSLAVRPFNELPRDVKGHGGHVIIVNMQKTPLDGLCEEGGVRIFTETDKFMGSLLGALNLRLSSWKPDGVIPQVRRRREVESELAELCAAQQNSTTGGSAGGGFCITPAASCPHAASQCVGTAAAIDVGGPCEECGRVGENWLCGQCQTLHCGRYVCGHMVRHAKETGHCIGFSLRDSSVWCFACDCYVDEGCVQEVQPLYQQLYFKKHGEWDPRPLLRSRPNSGGA